MTAPLKVDLSALKEFLPDQYRAVSLDRGHSRAQILVKDTDKTIETLQEQLRQTLPKDRPLPLWQQCVTAVITGTMIFGPPLGCALALRFVDQSSLEANLLAAGGVLWGLALLVGLGLWDLILVMLGIRRDDERVLLLVRVVQAIMVRLGFITITDTDRVAHRARIKRLEQELGRQVDELAAAPGPPRVFWPGSPLLDASEDHGVTLEMLAEHARSIDTNITALGRAGADTTSLERKAREIFNEFLESIEHGQLVDDRLAQLRPVVHDAHDIDGDEDIDVLRARLRTTEKEHEKTRTRTRTARTHMADLLQFLNDENRRARALLEAARVRHDTDRASWPEENRSHVTEAVAEATGRTRLRS